ncbi:hypothetical protein AKJ37_01720 [candidate division MSBL1 archaeon SCGC-AAA259I09]|uniref:Uncharacterized protein n=1 Tax=candidate division MSBL1 archaeon SCGC-AAA259I09 TaxID=1698267 RepID=A0A133UUW9_9EURY|nr:hypothetical protein AKJ37_01720 [candidate division MSBL1 archaeon SCGC-AAA259I09]
MRPGSGETGRSPHWPTRDREGKRKGWEYREGKGRGDGKHQSAAGKKRPAAGPLPILGFA